MKSRKASALLLSFFLMSLLIVGALWVNLLVSRDVRSIRTVVAGVQSFYAAEGMSELGLHTVKANLPGYETSFDDYAFSTEVLASLNMHAREAMVPCEDQSEDGWGQLGPNESVELPLFYQIDSTGTIVNSLEFYVEFYVTDEQGEVGIPPTNDVLRWKILGLQNAQTEAISEYIPLYSGHTTADNPTIFGTDVGALPTQYSYAKYYSNGRFDPIHPIKTFLQSHSYNYLVLTNMIQGGQQDLVYYRLTEQSGEAVCSYVALESAGQQDFGMARQELVTLVREGENLPVFDFVLYHTNNDDVEE